MGGWVINGLMNLGERVAMWLLASGKHPQMRLYTIRRGEAQEEKIRNRKSIAPRPRKNPT